MYGRDKYILFFLKLSIILPLGYAGIMGLLHPNDWISFVPAQVSKYIAPLLFLKGFSVFEIALSLLILWGKGLVFTATIAFLILAAISGLNYKTFDIFFRDAGLSFAALALAVFSYRR